MLRRILMHFLMLSMVLTTIVVGFGVAVAQQPAAPGQPPLFATTKITENTYVFRYGGHQAMFVVTPEDRKSVV